MTYRTEARLYRSFTVTVQSSVYLRKDLIILPMLTRIYHFCVVRPVRDSSLMPVTCDVNMARKNRAALALDREGDHKQMDKTMSTFPPDTSDEALADLLERLKATVDPNEIRHLPDQI